MRSIVLSLPVMLCVLTTAFAQGATAYLNFESPQVKPIAVGTVGTRNALFICNTPDNSVELYDITANPDSPVFVVRIPVGQEPVSVVYHHFTSPSSRNMLYTANWLGDSVTYVELFDSGGVITYSVVGERSVVGQVIDPAVLNYVHFVDPSGNPGDNLLRGDDEPMHLAVLDDGPVQSLIVTKRTASSYSRISAFDPTATAQPVHNNSGACVTLGGANVIITANALGQVLPPGGSPYVPFLHPTDGQFPFGEEPKPFNSMHDLLALKEPHTVLKRPNHSEYWILGHQGGSSKIAHRHEVEGKLPRFDFDIWGIHYPFNCSTPPTFTCVRGLGTTNFNMAFSPDGAALYVVGTDALNDREGNIDLLDEPTGFVKTMLYRVDMNDPGGNHDPLDLNAGAGPSTSLAHATDVGVYQAEGSTIDLVFVTAFNSDRFGVIEYDTIAKTWSAPRRCTITAKDRAQAVPGLQGAAGPRGLAVFDPGTAPGVRVYVLNRLDNNFVVIDPKAGTTQPPVAGVPIDLQVDQVPGHIRNGQRFLYSTKFSGSRFVACASCHVDARSDQLQWRLSVPDGDIPLFPAPADFRVIEAFDTTVEEAEDLAEDGMPNDQVYVTDQENPKGPMVTQSLQGLLNFEVLGTLFDDPTGNIVDDLVTNAPYHWRGDKESFRHFNEAFVNLQGMPPFNNPGEEPDGGLKKLEVPAYNENQAFETFINSISYPPNPLQPRDRMFSGVRVAGSETLGQRGLKLFHEQPASTFEGRSCVQCHFLPEGSNNRITCFLSGLELTDPEGRDVKQPTETSALRGLTQKDGRLHLNGRVPPGGILPTKRILTGDRGTGHEGLRGHSRSEFVKDVINVGAVPGDEKLDDIAVFMRELDHGVASVVGLTATIPGDTVELALMEAQAMEGNCGIAVYGELQVPAGGPITKVAYWYRFDDTPVGPPTQVYKQVGGATFSSADLVNEVNVTGERLIFRAVPLGSERRVAYLTGSGELPYSGSPPVPAEVKVVGTSPNTAYDIVPSFTRNWKTTGADPFNWTGDLHEPLSLRALRAFQLALNVPVQHDAPRRLQLTGLSLLQGARIRLKVPDGTPNPKTLIIPIYPTNQEYEGRMVWETAVEFDPMALYTLMLGGPANAGVLCVLDNDGDVNTAVSDVDLRNNCFPATLPLVTYDLDVQNVGGAWTAQIATTISYPKVP